jgi:hypothetical protein
MILTFGRFAHQRRLGKELGKHPIELAGLQELAKILSDQNQRQALPSGLLWKIHARSQKAMAELDDATAQALLSEITRGALWEVQSRELRGV